MVAHKSLPSVTSVVLGFNGQSALLQIYMDSLMLRQYETAQVCKLELLLN